MILPDPFTITVEFGLSNMDNTQLNTEGFCIQVQGLDTYSYINRCPINFYNSLILLQWPHLGLGYTDHRQ